MQNIGINPLVVYDAHDFEAGHPGFGPGQYGCDPRGNVYIFLEFQSNVDANRHVDWDADFVGEAPAGVPGTGRQSGFLSAADAVVATATAPVYAWVQVFGRALGSLRFAAAVDARLYLSSTTSAFAASGTQISGIQLLEVSDSSNTVAVHLTYPHTL